MTFRHLLSVPLFAYIGARLIYDVATWDVRSLASSAIAAVIGFLLYHIIGPERIDSALDSRIL